VSQGIVAAAPPGASVPARLRKIVTRGLAVDPDARWPGMEELLAALRVDPSRRRTRVLVLGGFAVALLGGAGGLAALDHQEHQRCRAEAATAHERWNDEVRERMTTSMRATDLAFVEPTIERTSATLDAWVRGWSEAREEVCNAATRDADDVVAPLRRACLDERLVHLEVTLELLAEADETTTSTAVQMVAGLPRLESCDDERWLRQRAAMVSGAGTDSGTALGVTRLIALVRARRTEPARALVDELLVATRDIPYLQAEVIHARGDLEEDSNDPGGALKHYEEAYFLAGKHQNDRIAALAAINLTMLVGVRIGDLEKGRSWAAHATMMVERDPDPELRNELLYAVGALETTAENHEVAIALFLEEAALAEQTFGAEHPETGYAHLALGNAYSSAGRTDEARAEFEIARGLWERTYGREHPTTVMVTYNLGNLAVFDGRIADALRLHREALAIRERIRKPGHMELAESYTAIGTLLAIQGDSHGALAEHQRALELKRTHMGADAPRTWLEMDNVIRDLIELDRRAEAEPLVAARCEAAERRRDTDTDGWMRCLGIQGDLLLAADRPRDAAARFEQAVGVADALYGASHLQARTVRQSWAHALMEAGEPARARALLERIVAEWNDTVAASHPDLRGALGLHGQASLELGDRAAAVRSLERALALAEQHGAAKEISLRRRELARARDVGGRP
jgi:tetratricopeptide (TPR) repeat protein